MSKSTFAVFAAVTVFATIVVAQEKFPEIDTQKLCRSRAQSIGEMMGETQVASRTFETCVNSEQQARDALVAAWKDIPASYKAACVKPGVYSPSYAEWISCLELNIDVKNLRQKR